MKRIAALLLVLICLFPPVAMAEKIERILSPDLSNAPWCTGVIFDMFMEEPDDFPSPVPMFQTEIAELDEAHLRSLLETYGMPMPDGERWYNGADRLNRRNYVFSEMNHGRYQLYSNPWGIRSRVDNKEHATALCICKNFLSEADIGQIEEPYYRVQRGNTSRTSTFDGAGTMLTDINLYPKEGNEQRYTGISFRYMLGGMPVAVELLDEPSQQHTEDSFAPAYGSMTVSDEGLITQFDLWNMTAVVKELPPYSGPLCTWKKAVDTVLSKLVNHTYPGGESHWLDGYQHLRIVAVEPNLALTPQGTTFPVWAVVYEYIGQFPSAQDGGRVYNSGVQYVDARTGKRIS